MTSKKNWFFRDSIGLPGDYGNRYSPAELLGVLAVVGLLVYIGFFA